MELDTHGDEGLEKALNFPLHVFVKASKNASEFGNLKWMLIYDIIKKYPILEISSEYPLETAGDKTRVRVVDVEFEVNNGTKGLERVSYRAFQGFQ